MVCVSIRKARLSDAVIIGCGMRDADRREVWASSHLGPVTATMSSLQRSTECHAGLLNDRPFCLFGIGVPSMLGARAVPWMLATGEIEDCPITFLRLSQQIVDGWREKFLLLHNMVDARNTVAIRWLRWLRFEIKPAIVHGKERLPFHPFLWERQDV